MSNALAQLKKEKFKCPKSIEISEYIQSILTPETITEDQDAVINYVVSVPFCIESIWEAAAEKNQEDRIESILVAIRNYFFEADDLIADHHGAIGLLDDAYMVYCYINELNQHSIQQNGTSFVELDLDYQQKLIANNLDAEISQQIEAHVKSTMDGAILAEQLKTAGKLLLGGLAIGFLWNSFANSGVQSSSDKVVELASNRIYHGW